ncbi:hypothetical protein CRG98_011140 [Punica granatum]|uniref:Uncharacterized protein n=1 Tax=Punica granatum TaxID=22663 RepID=A0A2I0KIZ5_PUNGR|nr:hypothetical protein CRG98_011140 [Punica granatum]
MARLAEVVGGNGTCRNSDAPSEGSWNPIILTAGTRRWRLQMENLSSEMGLGGGKYVGYEDRWLIVLDRRPLAGGDLGIRNRSFLIVSRMSGGLSSGAVYLFVERTSGEPRQEGVCECSGAPRLKQEASEMRSKWLSTPKRPLEMVVVVFLREVTRVEPICKKSEESQKTNRPDWAELTRLGRSERNGSPGGSRWYFATREKGRKWWRCKVEWLSAHDRLITGEIESREEPLESVGMTRHGREVVEMSRKPRKP